MNGRGEKKKHDLIEDCSIRLCSLPSEQLVKTHNRPIKLKKNVYKAVSSSSRTHSPCPEMKKKVNTRSHLDNHTNMPKEPLLPVRAFSVYFHSFQVSV